MAGRKGYVLGADVADDEVLRDRKGRFVDEAYVESAVEDAVGKAQARAAVVVEVRGLPAAAGAYLVRTRRGGHQGR
ncbi:MAG: hypothetical protein ACJ74O_06595 [Frankiaceae bacterium]